MQYMSTNRLLDWLEQWSIADPPRQKGGEAKLDGLATLLSEMHKSRESRLLVTEVLLRI